jgi:hypothetical protein
VAQRIDIVVANAGDSGALLVPFVGAEDNVAEANSAPDNGNLRGGSVNDHHSQVYVASTIGIVSGEAANIVTVPSGSAIQADTKGISSSGSNQGSAGHLKVNGLGAASDFKRLTREHNPDDPLEAMRLTDAGARLGRMRQGGKEVGPMRSYPGGLAVSRAIGDLGSPAVICEPECTRLSLPPGGGRLILASDGLWNAMNDGEVAEIAGEATTASEAAEALVRRAVVVRGLHDDITVLVVDLPPPGDMLAAAAEVQPNAGPPPALDIHTRNAILANRGGNSGENTHSGVYQHEHVPVYPYAHQPDRQRGGGSGGGNGGGGGDAMRDSSCNLTGRRLPPILASPRTSVGAYSVKIIPKQHATTYQYL